METRLPFKSMLLAKTILAVAFVFGAFTMHAQCTAPNLVGWWNFNGGSLSAATTELLHGWTPTNAVTVTQTAGRAGTPGTALAFNGTSDYLDYGYHPELDLTSWTLSAVVYPTGYFTGNCTGNAIVYRAPMFSDDHYSLVFTENPWYLYNSDPECSAYNTLGCSDNFSFEGVGPGYATFAGGDWCDGCKTSPVYGYVNTNTWYCITASYDGTTNTVKLYVDGNLAVTESPAFNTTYSYGSPLDLMIGSSDFPGGYFPYFFHGYIDDVKIFDGPVCNTDVSCNASMCPQTISIASPYDAVAFDLPATATVTYQVYDLSNNPIGLYTCNGADVLYSSIPGSRGTIALPHGAYRICVQSISIAGHLIDGACCVYIGYPSPRQANTSVAVVQQNNMSVSVVPNPNNGSFNLKGGISGTASEATIEIYDVVGRLILTDVAAINNNTINKSVNLATSIPNGTYSIKIKTADADKVLKFELNR